MLSKVACHGRGKEFNTVINSGVRIVGDGGLESIYTSLHLARQLIVHPTLYPSIHPASFPPPPTHSHLPASHHQCSQGDERHGEEGPQGINFSHGLESSSQKTWQPQTAWLKKKRREEERKGGGQRRRRRGGILHMMALREGFWILGVFFFFVQSPHVLVENEQIVPPVLSPFPVLPSLKMWVGIHSHYWLHKESLWLKARNHGSGSFWLHVSSSFILLLPNIHQEEDIIQYSVISCSSIQLYDNVTMYLSIVNLLSKPFCCSVYVSIALQARKTLAERVGQPLPA